MNARKQKALEVNALDAHRGLGAGGKRVLMCDFDGVLHPTLALSDNPSSGGLVATKHFGWVPALEGALRGHDDVAVVVHSTWRYMYDVEELRELLGPLGPRLAAAP